VFVSSPVAWLFFFLLLFSLVRIGYSPLGSVSSSAYDFATLIKPFGFDTPLLLAYYAFLFETVEYISSYPNK